MIQGVFPIDKQRKVTKSRCRNSCEILVVDNGDGMYIANVAKQSISVRHQIRSVQQGENIEECQD